MKDAAHPWEESRGMAYSYGYNRAESIDDYKTGRELIIMFADLVSRGGNLLLNIGPKPDGTSGPETGTGGSDGTSQLRSARRHWTAWAPSATALTRRTSTSRKSTYAAHARYAAAPVRSA